MNRQFEGKVAIVTGGSSGIGRASALAFAKNGANVVVADVAVTGGKETVQMIRKAGGEAIFVEVDVSKAWEVEMLIDRTIESYGRLDCAHNNAGIEGAFARTADYTEEDWDRVININLKGVWLCMKYEIPRMLQGGKGAIVNTASLFGLVGFRGSPAYCASKGAIVQLTRTAALEYAASGIRINAICPGIIHTPMLDRATGGKPEVEAQFIALEPVGRLGTPEEIAEAAIWLCSDASSFVTGHAMVADGGFTVQ